MTPICPCRSPRAGRMRPLAAHLAAGLIALAAGTAQGQTQAQGQDDVTKSHGIATFGELKYPADFDHLDYVNPDAPKGGEISVWAFGAFDSMNPYTTRGRAGRLSNILYESLLTTTADTVGQSYGLLAGSLEYPENRRWVIFDLRPEARFANGDPVTAEDVKFSYHLFRDKGLPSFRAVLQRQVASAEVLGKRRIKFTFKEGIPTRDLPQSVGGLPVFSKAAYQKNDRDFEETSLQPLMGSGPYQVGSIDTGETIVYERDEDYWGADLPINQGRNNFDSIRIEYYADYNAAFEGFKGGTYTFRNEASSKSWATGYGFPAVENGYVKKVALKDGTIATGQSFVFNLRRKKFQDRRVREAIRQMFNFKWSNKTLFYGLYARIESFWENSYLAAEGKPSAAERKLLEPMADILPPGVLDSPPVTPPEGAERQLNRRALRTASRLLSEAGYTVGDDGMRRGPDGEVLSIEFLNDSPTFDRVINPFVASLRRLGIDARLARVDNAEFTQRERSYQWDIITTQFPMDYIPGDGLRQYFGSETADNSVFNLMGLKSEAVDRLIDHVVDAGTEKELEASVHALDRTLRAIKFWIPQWYKDTYTVAYYDMYRHPDPLPKYAPGFLDFWWYDAEAARKLRDAGVLR